MSIIVVHNGGLSIQALAPLLRKAELAGDMETYEELLRTPLPALCVIEMPEESLVFGIAVEAFPLRMAPQEEEPIFTLPPRHYRDLEYPQQGRRSQIKRTRQGRR